MTVRHTDEPPVGFQVCYYDKNGLRSVPVKLAVYDGSDPVIIKQMLYEAYCAICHGINPKGPALPRNIRRLVNKSIEKTDGPEAA